MTSTVRTCIAGGGPAGMMLGFLLARAGREVVVLEKHADFFRDFRGDTIHPSTLDVMVELGLRDKFLALPHDELRELSAQIGECHLRVADFTHVPTKCKFLAFMPQWDFLNFIAEQARAYPNFHLRMEAEVTDLLFEGPRVAGVRGTERGGPFEERADLIIGADGRSSVVRERAGLIVHDIGAPMDVLWFRVSRVSDDPAQTLGRVDAGRIMIMIGRDEYWQCGWVIRKGEYENIQRRGLDAFRSDVLLLAPFLRGRIADVASWDDVKVLTVKVDRLERWWRDGLLCIGDAAHAMSPIGGVGINLAIQDAVATANILCSADPATSTTLALVQRRRELPTRVTQAVQVFIQGQIIDRVLGGTGRAKPPAIMRLLDRWSLLRRIPAQAVGVGVLPEHVRSPAVAPAATGTP